MAKKSHLIQKTFEHWYPDELQTEFGLQSVEKTPSLLQWIHVQYPVPKEIQAELDALRKKLKENHTYWNEFELFGHFITHLLYWVKFEGVGFNSFAQRKMGADIKGYKVTGTVDWVVSKGIRKPIAPYFFIHEYKRYNLNKANPLGQLLSELLVAQKLNQSEKAIYGCYIVGQTWTFVLLEGQIYSTSKGYDATDPDEINEIWSILQETKRRVIERAAM